MTRLFSLTAAAVMLMSIGGCALMREDTAPFNQIAIERIRLTSNIEVPQDTWPSTHWWQRYRDRQLDGLIEQALKDSPTMVVFAARVEASRAQARLVDASHGVQVGLIAALNRTSVSEQGFLGHFGTTGPWYTEGIVGLGAGYSVDLWGKHRAQFDAALGVQRARQAEAAEAGLRLSAQIAHVYFDIQTTYSVLVLLEQARDIEQENMDAHSARAARGLEPQTQTEVALTHRLELDQQINSAKTRIRTLHEMLRTLVGTGPDELGVMSPLPLPDSAGGVPSSLGFELLARRPDLQAMRWYIQASLDQVEAAKAAFYPSFDIRAFAGFDSLHLEHLLEKSSRQINLIPGLSLPIFDSGRLNANLAVARSQSNVLIAQYNQSVLNAVREVAQAGIELDGLNRQASMQQAKLTAATVSLDGAEAHSRRGLLDEASAMEAKLPVLREQARMLEIRSRQIHAGISPVGGPRWRLRRARSRSCRSGRAQVTYVDGLSKMLETDARRPVWKRRTALKPADSERASGACHCSRLRRCHLLTPLDLRDPCFSRVVDWRELWASASTPRKNAAQLTVGMPVRRASASSASTCSRVLAGTAALAG